MKYSTVVKTFTITAVATLALSFSPAAKADDKGCSNASLQGTYGYSSVGTITAPPDIAGPVAEVGTQFFDGRGNTTATATLSSNGTLFPLTITGTYTVHPDCTGTFTLQVAPFGITVDVLFVIDDGWNEFRAIETDSGFVITRVGRKLYPGRAI
ncbi:MAG TPA: hypothetical protein VKG79_04010 [Bryobacteraceae bacterium]|nr:hypothetical protein [Bryobacteraceae bacterium]